MKAIFSSFSLYGYLEHTALLRNDNAVSLVDNKFSVSGSEMMGLDVTHKGEGTVNISGRKLRMLRELLGKIPDQPVTVEFSFDQIAVSHIEI